MGKATTTAAICQVTVERRFQVLFVETASGNQRLMNSKSMEPSAAVQVARVENDSRYRNASRADSPAPARSGTRRPVDVSQYLPRAAYTSAAGQPRRDKRAARN